MSREDEGWLDPDEGASLRREQMTAREWENHLAREGRRAAHCGKSGCLCRHEGCYHGWIDWTDADGHPFAQPCRTCRPTTSQKVAAVPPPGMRSGADFAVLRKGGFGE